MARAGPGSGEVILRFQPSGDLFSERAPFPHSAFESPCGERGYCKLETDSLVARLKKCILK
jgi:hypothetical protein